MVLKFLGGNKTDFRSSWFTYYHVRWNSSTALFPVKNVKRKKTKTLEKKQVNVLHCYVIVINCKQLIVCVSVFVVY